MAAPWEQFLEKWQDAGFIDPEKAARIREFEARGGGGPAGLRWPAIAAIAFGAMMMTAGVLLFVSAHWDDLAPATRFAMVLLMVAIFHAGGAWASLTMEPLAMALHGIGTAALGAGIYLSGQIFYMAEHWPSGMLMWAAGACRHRRVFCADYLPGDAGAGDRLFHRAEDARAGLDRRHGPDPVDAGAHF